MGEGNEIHVVGMSMRVAKGTVPCNFTGLLATGFGKEADNRVAGVRLRTLLCGTEQSAQGA
jgi:hypothetical protein